MRKRNKFSLSHFRLLTGKMGYLYPISCMETLPGDTFQMSSSVFIRFSPLVSPVMTPVIVKIHHWFVPLRLIWDDFEDFITGGPDGMSTPIPPYRNPGVQVRSLMDYFGAPIVTTNGSGGMSLSMLPARAYNLIWNEWYRDQNLQEEIVFPTTSGPESSTTGTTPLNLLRSAWDKDYFTTATPWEQKGVAVSVPVNGTPAGTISISGAPGASGSTGDGNSAITQLAASGSTIGSSPGITLSKGTLAASFTGSASLGNIDLNQFREAMALQRFEEHRALYGSRYVEYLRYLGVKASDARLQRPEYLGGGRSVIQFSEVLQTAEGEDPVGTMRGHGIGAIRTNRFRRFFEEHGFVISLLSIRPKSFYMQGLPRMFSRKIKTDYWQKELEHIGQQEVLNKEIYVPSNPINAGIDDVFGYSDRYDEYRSCQSSVHGEFHDVLDYWHLGRNFSAKPVLNGDFISSLPTDRIFADRTGNDTIYMMVNNSVQARRPVSLRGNPR